MCCSAIMHTIVPVTMTLSVSLSYKVSCGVAGGVGMCRLQPCVRNNCLSSQDQIPKTSVVWLVVKAVQRDGGLVRHHVIKDFMLCTIANLHENPLMRSIIWRCRLACEVRELMHDEARISRAPDACSGSCIQQLQHVAGAAWKWAVIGCHASWQVTVPATCKAKY